MYSIIFKTKHLILIINASMHTHQVDPNMYMLAAASTTGQPRAFNIIRAATSTSFMVLWSVQFTNIQISGVKPHGERK